MTTDPPPPGSAWHGCCPDAFPFEWYQSHGLSALPNGFTRFATDAEAAVITGAGVGDAPATATPKAGEKPKPPQARKPPATPKSSAAGGGRFQVLNAFVDRAARDLTRAELVTWLVLYRDVRAATGTATVSQKYIAERGGLSERAVQAAVQRLTVQRGIR